MRLTVRDASSNLVRLLTSCPVFLLRVAATIALSSVSIHKTINGNQLPINPITYITAATVIRNKDDELQEGNCKLKAVKAFLAIPQTCKGIQSCPLNYK